MPIGQPTFKPGSISISGAQSVEITNHSIATPNSETQHSLQTNLKQLIIRNRTFADLKLSFVQNESGTKYMSVPRGTTLSMDSLDFASKTLYLQSPKASTVEILELY